MSDHSNRKSSVRSIAEFVSARWPVAPRLGVILGSGSGQIAKAIQVEVELDYESIPGFPKSTAIGHRGRLVCGNIASCPTIALQGRFHPYEGHPFDRVTLPIVLFHELGIKSVLITNAAGGLNPRFCVGDLMAIRSHIDMMNLSSNLFSRITTVDGKTTPNHRPLRISDSAYDEEWIDLAMSTARNSSFVMHSGTYAGLLGPNYETRAEIRMLRRFGADAVGMSTIGEVAAAAAFSMRVLAISVVTNVANPDQLAGTSGQEVIDAAKVAEPALVKLVTEMAKSQIE